MTSVLLRKDLDTDNSERDDHRKTEEKDHPLQPNDKSQKDTNSADTLILVF